MADFRFKVSSKYRRAFSWRVSNGSPHSLQTDARAILRMATSEFPAILEDALYISRKRRGNWTSLSRLQMQMFEELLTQEKTIKRCKDMLRGLGVESEPASADDRPSQEIMSLREQLFAHELYANAFRAIGDGIAWRALGYDRAVTRTLCERQTKQILASEGTIEELRVWSSHFENGAGLAIFNALTNCLAIGDVTVVRDDGSVQIVEVKSSKTTSSRTVRQRQKMREVVSRLMTGEGQAGGRDMQIEILSITPETGLDRIERLLDAATGRGWAAAQISNCLYVEAFDFRSLPDDDATKQRINRQRDECIGAWDRRGDIWYSLKSLDMIALNPNAAPYSIYPFSDRTCVELLIGAKHIISYLNYSAVGREFEYRGWQVEKDPRQILRESEAEGATRHDAGSALDIESFLRISKGDFHANILTSDFVRMLGEALRPKSVIEACDAMFKLGPREGGLALTLFDGEPEVWD